MPRIEIRHPQDDVLTFHRRFEPRNKLADKLLLAEKLEMKAAANVSQQLRRLDGKAALKKIPDELKHFLAKINAPN
jgi:hypothetical protein